jgi:methylglutaconyl-CoA hydratase
MNKYLLTEIDEQGLATVTMNRPELHNAFDDEFITALINTFKCLDSDPAVRVVILAASGKSFSAGADLNWMRRMADYSHEENLADSMCLAGLLSSLNGLSKPTIALVQGAAYGGGVGLVACCDIALATERAVFCLSEVKLGLIPAVISPYVVEAIGSRAARRYFLTAERFDADEAHRIGLIHEMVTTAELQARGKALGAILAQNGPSALTAAKELITFVAKAPIDDVMIADTASRIAATRGSDEGKEGVSAFLQKSSPSWVKG